MAMYLPSGEMIVVLLSFVSFMQERDYFFFIVM